MLTEIKQKFIKHCNYYCESTDIKTVFSSFKVGDLFSVKESLSKYLRSFVVCRFTFPGCNASFISESTLYLTMKINQTTPRDSLKAHIFKYLRTNRSYKEFCDTECFEIMDSATSSYRLRLIETMHIIWEGPSLNK